MHVNAKKIHLIKLDYLMETISESSAGQALLVSALTNQPTHISGIWYAWGGLVLPKRLLLLVLIRAHGTSNIAHAGAIVQDYYKRIQHRVPAKHRLQLDSKQTIHDWIGSLWAQINSAAKITDPIEFGSNTFLATFETDITGQQLKDYILEIWGREEYEESLHS